MKTFLKPLTISEERTFLEQLKQGEREAKDVLVERNMRLVAHIVKKYSQTDYEMEDLISIGTIGLIKAVDTFNPDRANRLGTYAAKCIDNEILMFLRAERKKGREVSLYEPIGTDKEGNVISLVDIIEAESKDVAEKISTDQDIKRMHEAYGEILSDREKQVIAMRYGLFGGKEHTQREVASVLGISRSYVSRIEKGALLKLRDVMDRKSL
ncbi:RNA polymerase sporulation sigma factor SigK [Lacrimispora sp. NSJ-141]|uniref:RNA polymerase sigma factor n=2 Tax=Lachnospiraceae TaxID=186803 RepID=A0A7G9G5W0_9FIRM|nr:MULTISPECIES: RNA polymerase sporulation sigma factor SigK [Lachnospiraceae]MCD2491390.1 RNA polymerase sporulation sigma factor SigK [Lientehia hominis]QNM06192.1 RNA polymerase sporulation sigma factor SigK [Qiania dongpingensis]